MGAQTEFKAVINQLKKILKARKITYKDLAAKLAMPASTLKKMFTADDCSFSRLADVCSAIDLSVIDLLSATHERNVLEVRFSERQEDLFKSQPLTFIVYWLLVYERQTPEAVKERLGTEEKNFRHALTQLDRVDLLELRPDGSTRIPAVRPVTWTGTSDFVVNLKKRWATDLLADATAKKASDPPSFCVQYFQLSDASHDLLREALASLEQEFAKRTASDLAVHGANVTRLRFCYLLEAGSFITTSDGRRSGCY